MSNVLKDTRKQGWGRTLAFAGIVTALATIPLLIGLGLTGSTGAEAAPLSAPTQIAVVSGNNQSGTTGFPLGKPFVASVTDSTQPVEGAKVNWAITKVRDGDGQTRTANGQKLSATTSTTDASGKTSTVLTLGDEMFYYEVTATVDGQPNLTVTFTAHATTKGTPANLVATSGGGQSGPTGSTLPTPLVVTVTDGNDNPVTSAMVSWSVTISPPDATGQTLASATTTTGSNGQATTTFTLGNSPGAYEVTATVDGIPNNPVRFTLTAAGTVTGYTTMVVTSGTGQAGAMRSALPNPLVVTVTDANGNPLSGSVVNWNVTVFPRGAEEYRLVPNQSTTGANGEASTSFTLGDKPGAYEVTAKANDIPNNPVRFYLTARPATQGTPASVVVTSGAGQSGAMGTTLPSPLVVTVTTSSAGPVINAEVTWLVTLIPLDATGHKLAAATTFTGEDGQASTTFTLGDKPGFYEVTATAMGLPNSPVKFKVSATAPVPPGGLAPTGLSPMGGAMLSHLGTELTWTSPIGATQYQLQVIPFANDGPGVNIIGNVTNSFTLPAPPQWTGLLPGMSYTWQVRTTASMSATPAADEWGPWAQGSFRTPGASSATIKLNPVSAGGSLTPTLSWSDSNNEIYYYEVQVSADPQFTAGFLYSEFRHGGVTDPRNSYTVPSAYPLQPGTTYFWRVRPRIQGDGTPVAWSPANSFVTP